MKFSHVRTAVWVLAAVITVLLVASGGLETGYGKVVFIALLVVGIVAGGLDFLAAVIDFVERESELEEHPKAPLGQSGNGVE